MCSSQRILEKYTISYIVQQKISLEKYLCVGLFGYFWYDFEVINKIKKSPNNIIIIIFLVQILSTLNTSEDICNISFTKK